MSDKPPLLFSPRFGALHPINSAARDAVKALTGDCRVEIKRSGANERRRGFYWVMLDVAAEALTDRTGFPFDQELLHDALKQRLGLGETFTSPNGSTFFKPRSTSNRAMTEPDRARWTDRCTNVLSHWLQVPVADLMNEARRREGQEIAA